MLTLNAIGFRSVLDHMVAHQEGPCADKQFPSKEEILSQSYCFFLIN